MFVLYSCLHCSRCRGNRHRGAAQTVAEASELWASKTSAHCWCFVLVEAYTATAFDTTDKCPLHGTLLPISFLFLYFLSWKRRLSSSSFSLRLKDGFFFIFTIFDIEHEKGTWLSLESSPCSKACLLRVSLFSICFLVWRISSSVTDSWAHSCLTVIDRTDKGHNRWFRSVQYPLSEYSRRVGVRMTVAPVTLSLCRPFALICGEPYKHWEKSSDLSGANAATWANSQLTCPLFKCCCSFISAWQSVCPNYKL